MLGAALWARAFIHEAGQHVVQPQREFGLHVDEIDVVPPVVGFIRVLSQIVKLTPIFVFIKREAVMLGDQGPDPGRSLEAEARAAIIVLDENFIPVLR